MGIVKTEGEQYAHFKAEIHLNSPVSKCLLLFRCTIYCPFLYGFVQPQSFPEFMEILCSSMWPNEITTQLLSTEVQKSRLSTPGFKSRGFEIHVIQVKFIS